MVIANIPLNDKNWFQTGGPARFFATPSTTHELQEAVNFAQTQSLPIFVLGKGANVLISDDGFDGLIINPRMTDITISQSNMEILVKAGAGTTMEALIEFCLAHNIIGLEEFSGIPGTVGGSVFINLHYYDHLLADFLVEAELLDLKTNTVIRVPKAWFNFGYNQSQLQSRSHILICATFTLKKASDIETAFARGRSVEIIRHRAKRYPTSNTCGSFFRNFHADEVTELTSEGKKMIFVAYYLDKINAKGSLRIGGARVSHQHANMLVTSNGATSQDIIGVARIMQERVYEQFGVMPQPECLLVGFKEYPLHG